jgi:isoquinoline 1-oxidoreductase beta subunit
MLRLNVNDETRDVDTQDDAPLLFVLRDHCGLTAAKPGCRIGECAACTVFVDGEKRFSCKVELRELAGVAVTTAEGWVANHLDHPLVKHWIDQEVAQCGYCQPGMLLSAAALLDHTLDPSPSDLAEFMDGICRCGTYPRMLRAIELAAADLRAGHMSSAARLPRTAPVARAERQPPSGWELNPYITVTTDGEVWIAGPAAEMGQGTLTSLAVIVAEELDADWSSVRAYNSPADDARYGNPIWWANGVQVTAASNSVTGYYDKLRRVGAQGRQLLLDTAAEHWGVDADTLRTKPGVVIDDAHDRRLTYAELVASNIRSVVTVELDDVSLKDPGEFRLIGARTGRADIVDKTLGTATFSVDVRVPGMAYARLKRSPVLGAVPLRYNAAAIEALGCQAVQLPDAVAVVADTYEKAYRGIEALEVEWSTAPGDYFDSATAKQHQAALAAALDLAGFPAQQEGDFAAEADREGARTIPAGYETDFQYGAYLEPLNAVASVTSAGAEVWTGTQAPTALVEVVAAELQIHPSDVTLHRTYMGGGFGRRGNTDHDWALDAVRLSRHAGRPVKLLLMRADDLPGGRFKPASAHQLRAVVNDEQLVGIHHRVVSDEPLRMAARNRWEGSQRYPATISYGLPIPYPGLRHRSAEAVVHQMPVRLSIMRGVNGTPSTFARESFIDEVAAELGRDPLDLRLDLVDEAAARVLRAVADASAWPTRATRAVGISYAQFEESRFAYVAEVDLDRADGTLRVTDVWVAADIGRLVQPYDVMGQLEGGVVFGTSNALFERITITDGRTDQHNFDEYRVLKLAEAPRVHAQLLDSDAPPSGVADPVVCGVPAAIANAFAAATGGKRLRSMPFLPDRILAAIDA